MLFFTASHPTVSRNDNIFPETLLNELFFPIDLEAFENFPTQPEPIDCRNKLQGGSRLLGSQGWPTTGLLLQTKTVSFSQQLDIHFWGPVQRKMLIFLVVDFHKKLQSIELLIRRSPHRKITTVPIQSLEVCRRHGDNQELRQAIGQCFWHGKNAANKSCRKNPEIHGNPVWGPRIFE